MNSETRTKDVLAKVAMSDEYPHNRTAAMEKLASLEAQEIQAGTERRREVIDVVTSEFPALCYSGPTRAIQIPMSPDTLKSAAFAFATSATVLGVFGILVLAKHYLW